MYFVALLWAVCTIAVGFSYAEKLAYSERPNRWVAVILSSLSWVAFVWLLLLDWRVWALPALLGGYQIVNLMRYMYHRLPAAHLSSVTLRAHIWLGSLQGLLVVVGWVFDYAHHLTDLLMVLAGLQLLTALLLLRSSVHTWRHTRPFLLPEHYSDKQLPSLSVLIPARNETDALEQCLEHLVTNDYPKLEIIVLDDNSANRRTPEIIRSFAHAGVRFVGGKALDESRWLAKNQAYEKLRHEASGELLLFCGVDALFGTSSLRELVGQLLSRQKDMLSVLPLRDETVASGISLLQPMRYYWELCLPRRIFKRPPVLSTCWLIKAEVLDSYGGFEAVTRTITPEAYFARRAVVTDAYAFLRSNHDLALYSNKPAAEQYDTSVRLRYPQLHRRLELVAFTTLVELLLMVGPVVLLIICAWLPHTFYFLAVSGASTFGLLLTYYLAAVGTGLNPLWLAWALMPVAYLTDIGMQHISMYRYEFSRVEWKGRDAAVPVMQVIPRLPKV